MELEQLFSKEGEYVDRNGNTIDKRKLRFLGQGHLISLRIDLSQGVSEQHEEYYKEKISVLFHQLKELHAEYGDANSYIININQFSQDNDTCTYCYPILFLKNSVFKESFIKENLEREEIQDSVDTQSKRKRCRPRKVVQQNYGNEIKYSADNQFEEKKDMPKWVNLSFEERIKYSVEGQFEEGKGNPSFNLTKGDANYLISNNVLGELGYEIVSQKDTDYGFNFKVKRAS